MRYEMSNISWSSRWPYKMFKDFFARRIFGCLMGSHMSFNAMSLLNMKKRHKKHNYYTYTHKKV